MHAIHLFIAASVLAGQAFANTEAIDLLDKRDISNTLLAHAFHFKRQAEASDETGGLAGIPKECEATCDVYMTMANRCTSMADSVPATSSSPTTYSANQLLQCACNDEFMAATEACIECAPQEFKTGDDYDGSMILEQAKAECARAGLPVKGGTTTASAADDVGDERVASGKQSSDNGNSDSNASSAPNESGDAADPSASGSEKGAASAAMSLKHVMAGSIAALVIGTLCFV